uniref:Uncharacterized protein n=1 Tax=Panagrolaimus davidi TaxID=227884 RepID=A0A914Q7K8_9BILA
MPEVAQYKASQQLLNPNQINQINYRRLLPRGGLDGDPILMNSDITLKVRKEEIRKLAGMFLRNSIERILSDRDIKKKEHAQLKQACESALEQLNAEIERHTKQSTGGILPNLQEYILADNYFHPFELACQSKSPKIVVSALDCLQKLIAYGHLIGDSPDSANPDRLLIDRIVEAICFPFQGPHTDDIVQLQIIKAILAVVLSNTARAHEGSLLLAVRTCFNIYLASRSQVNQSTAKGILTQTINSVFVTLQRQEQQDNNIELDLDEMVVKSVLDSAINQIVSMEHSVKEITVATEEPSSSGSLTNGIAQNSPSTSAATHHNPHAGVASLSVESLVETLPNSIDEAGSKLEFKSTEEKDAFLIFRALCKLSMKNLPDAPDPKSHELRSKLLSLEMILLVLQNFNAPLSDKHSFIFAIRHFLCVALTQNAVSQIIAVFEKALAIFVQLVNRFRVHLKRQIEVFFKEIIILILKSPSSSFEHKWIVMHTISKIFDNYQSVVDIYINYDCHLTSPNILQVLVDELSKISKNSTSDAAPNNSVSVKEREKKMQVLALECLVKVYKALILFYEEMVFSKSELSTNEDQEENEINGALIAQQYEQLKQRKSIIEHGIDL